jgi:3-deoxy-D-manno-octulosonate 8-phosphate phosphatase (KDO 8-P phosphatase)
MKKKKQTALENIEMLVLDIDGVMTDGSLIINSDGSESKKFNSLDGHGIRLWKRAGKKVAFLSGRKSEPVIHRAEQLEVDYVLENCFDKLDELKKLISQSNIPAGKIAYIGDDLPDLPAIRCVGFSAVVANAVDEVKQYADYVTVAKGGCGAVREVIEYILKSSGIWDKLIRKYLVTEKLDKK